METIERPRSEDLVPHEKAKHTSVDIIGAGAIGSNVAFALSKMGVGWIRVFDDDVVGAENLEPQVYHDIDIGQRKVDALSGHLLLETYYTGVPARVGPDGYDPRWLVVSGVDSMSSRQGIANCLFDDATHWGHYIDGRMGGNIIEVYHVTPETLRGYYREAITHAEVMELPCSATAVAYNGLMCATYIARMVAAILKDEPVPYYLKIDLLAWAHVVRLQQ